MTPDSLIEAGRWSCAICSRPLPGALAHQTGIGPLCERRLFPRQLKPRRFGGDLFDIGYAALCSRIEELNDPEGIDGEAILAELAGIRFQQDRDLPKARRRFWRVVSWLAHHVEPWLWQWHRDLVDASMSDMLRASAQIMQGLGGHREASWIASHLQAIDRRGRRYRNRIYRYLKWGIRGE